jgi:hypothetical protein
VDFLEGDSIEKVGGDIGFFLINMSVISDNTNFPMNFHVSEMFLQCHIVAVNGRDAWRQIVHWGLRMINVHKDGDIKLGFCVSEVLLWKDFGMLIR